MTSNESRIAETSPWWRRASQELREWRGWRKRTFIAIGCALVSVPAAEFGLASWWPPQHYSDLGRNNIDATVMISTMVLVYAFFIAAYGTLTPMIVELQDSWWRAAVLIFVSFAVVLDLFRILNSTADLYRTTMRQLNAAAVYDVVAEFAGYFIVNALVVGIALWAVSRQRASADDGSHRATTGVGAGDCEGR